MSLKSNVTVPEGSSRITHHPGSGALGRDPRTHRLLVEPVPQSFLVFSYGCGIVVGVLPSHHRDGSKWCLRRRTVWPPGRVTSSGSSSGGSISAVTETYSATEIPRTSSAVRLYSPCSTLETVCRSQLEKPRFRMRSARSSSLTRYRSSLAALIFSARTLP